mmetsp:Transcript_23492/g.66873  ORF Transcript_23492/g.66873 Transcript_23492/m.66873 type:complete len:241 (-) Transcript_23492:3695-4417(-)
MWSIERFLANRTPSLSGSPSCSFNMTGMRLRNWALTSMLSPRLTRKTTSLCISFAFFTWLVKSPLLINSAPLPQTDRSTSPSSRQSVSVSMAVAALQSLFRTFTTGGLSQTKPKLLASMPSSVNSACGISKRRGLVFMAASFCPSSKSKLPASRGLVRWLNSFGLSASMKRLTRFRSRPNKSSRNVWRRRMRTPGPCASNWWQNIFTRFEAPCSGTKTSSKDSSMLRSMLATFCTRTVTC